MIAWKNQNHTNETSHLDRTWYLLKYVSTSERGRLFSRCLEEDDGIEAEIGLYIN